MAAHTTAKNVAPQAITYLDLIGNTALLRIHILFDGIPT